MTLKIGSNGNGIYVNRRVITGVENLSGLYKSDITLKLYFERVQRRDGGAFEPTHTIFANYKKDEATGRITGWGQAFKVALLLERVGGYRGEVKEDGTIPEAALLTLIRKECFILSYPARHREEGTRVVNNYQIVAGIEMWDRETRGLIPGDEWLRKEFNRELEAGYVKDFWIESEPISTHVIPEPGF